MNESYGCLKSQGNLDLASDGETEQMEIVGSTKKIDGNYYAEGPWSDDEKEAVGILFKQKN